MDARLEVEQALARTRSSGSVRCVITSVTAETRGEIDFRLEASRWRSVPLGPIAPPPADAIYADGRCYWMTSEGWREIRVPGQKAPFLGFLAPAFEAIADRGRSIERVGTDDPVSFLVVGRVSGILERIDVNLDEDGRLQQIVKRSTPVDGPEDALIPSNDEIYELYDYGIEVSVPTPPEAGIMELPE
jgi:hypothetical protein